MRSAGKYVAFTLAAVVLLGAAAPSYGAAPILLASNRCNGQTIDDASSRIREYDRHAPGTGSAKLLQRFGAIAEVIATLNEERGVLDSVCSDTQRAPLFAQIAAYSAWALALQSDLAAKLNASCPAAATALPSMMLADAWLALANVINAADGAVPTALEDVIPKVRMRAEAVGLALPAWTETSAYWAGQVHDKAQTAIATCPSPSPSPSAGELRIVRK